MQKPKGQCQLSYAEKAVQSCKCSHAQISRRSALTVRGGVSGRWTLLHRDPLFSCPPYSINLSVSLSTPETVVQLDQFLIA